ncbi:unnamed protein product [Clonostachys byssicola]|uniref:Hydrophobin n=1 Tax=Clonostachys byssicola TaxID=160290 RepID=A0A9N9U7R5_9HYPO|nr:unnamed protein product [Clonostachys byssicola]
MKFSLAASTLGLAALALAAPAEFEVRGGSSGGGWGSGGGGGGGGGGGSTPPSNTQNNNQQCGPNESNVCCESGACYVAQGSNDGSSNSVSCSQTNSATVYCCQTNSSPGSLINIQALNCNEIGSIPVTIPVSVGKKK